MRAACTAPDAPALPLATAWPSASAAAARTGANVEDSAGSIWPTSAGRSSLPSARMAMRWTASLGWRVPSSSVFRSAPVGARRSSASKMAWRTAWTDAESDRS